VVTPPPADSTLEQGTAASADLDSAVVELAQLDLVDTRNLVSAVALICGDPTLAEEAMQEAVLRGWQKAKRGEHVESWSSWVLTVALNHTRSHFRRVGRERVALQRLARQLENRHQGRDRDDQIASAVDLLRAMRKLTRRQREVVTMHYRLDITVAEIATSLGVSEGTVKTLLHRARIALLPLVEEKPPKNVLYKHSWEN
jgi:RNA polymerase sigma-70 factor, ECF subfamily